MENLTAKQLLNAGLNKHDIKNDKNEFKTYDIYKIAQYVVLNVLDMYEIGEKLEEWRLYTELQEEIESLFIYDYDLTRFEMENIKEIYFRLEKKFNEELGLDLYTDFKNKALNTTIDYIHSVAMFIILEQLQNWFIEFVDFVTLDERNFKEIVVNVLNDEHTLQLRHVIQ